MRTDGFVRAVNERPRRRARAWGADAGRDEVRAESGVIADLGLEAARLCPPRDDRPPGPDAVSRRRLAEVADGEGAA